jgi:hypothetical protein
LVLFRGEEGEFMTKFVVFAVVASAIGLVPGSSADTLKAVDSPRVGEIRAFVVSPRNVDAVMELHQSGWIEARGQLVDVESYPELYRVVGREWTAAGVSEQEFAVPQVRDERFLRAVATANVYRVLGPGDLITGGREIKSSSRLNPITYWIFVGRRVDGTAGPLSAEKRR